jgi:hypothetical protein
MLILSASKALKIWFVSSSYVSGSSFDNRLTAQPIAFLKLLRLKAVPFLVRYAFQLVSAFGNQTAAAGAGAPCTRKAPIDIML